jgi:hypothetical protein
MSKIGLIERFNIDGLALPLYKEGRDSMLLRIMFLWTMLPQTDFRAGHSESNL